MYLEERVSIGRILLMSARSAKALSPIRLYTPYCRGNP